MVKRKGISKAAKKESRIAAEGLTEAQVDGNVAVLLEVNCETDFVAQNEDFKGLVSSLIKTLLHNDVKTMEEANKLTIDGGSETVEETIVNFVAKIGEKLVLEDLKELKRLIVKFLVYIHIWEERLLQLLC